MDESGRKITKIAREAGKFTLKMMKEEGIGTAEFDFIHFIRHNPGVTQAKVREQLKIDKGAAARRAANLESKGYLYRKPNPEDGRSQLLYATEKAEQLKNSKASIESVFYEWLLAELPKEEKAAFLETLDKLYWRSKEQRRAEFCDVPIFSGDKEIYRKVGSPDICIHLAWRDGFRHNSPAHMKDLSAHVTFLNDLVAGGLKDLSVMGTMHEVGYWEGAINESTPCKPQSQYGIAKNALRQSLMLSLDGSPCKLHWLRAYYITGDEAHGSSIFAKLAQAELDGKKTFPFTSGKNLYDFIDVDELANMIVAASVQEEINGIINVCTGEPRSLADRVEQFLRDKNYKIKLDYGAFPDRPYDSPGTWGDATKIKQILAKDQL